MVKLFPNALLFAAPAEGRRNEKNSDLAATMARYSGYNLMFFACQLYLRLLTS